MSLDLNLFFKAEKAEKGRKKSFERSDRDGPSEISALFRRGWVTHASLRRIRWMRKSVNIYGVVALHLTQLSI